MKMGVKRQSEGPQSYAYNRSFIQNSLFLEHFRAKHGRKLNYLTASPPLCACRADNPRSVRRPALNASDKRGGASHRLRFVYGGR